VFLALFQVRAFLMLLFPTAKVSFMFEPGFATPADMALCRQLIRQGSKSFHLASLLLPARYRERARMLYGFCRVADDLVDDATDAAQAVADLKIRLDNIYGGQPSDDPTDRAFADLVRHHAIPRALPDALIDGFLWDAQSRNYQTLSDVTAYAVRVAGTVGVMMSLLMEVRSPEALSRALDLGVAMQFSNIARDVEEDAARGRVYLPADWLKQQSAAEAATRLVDIAEQLYARSTSGIALLPANCRASIAAAHHLYRAIGHQSVAQRHVGRAVVPRSKKLALVAKASLASLSMKAVNSEACLDEGQYLLDAVRNWQLPLQPPSGVVGKITWVMDMFAAVENRRS
jgi:15-cis-phytoene synthase